MKCRHARRMLADYVNGVLSSEDSNRIQKHIAECESCRRELDTLLKVLKLIDDVKVEYPPASIWQNFIPDLHKRIEKEAALVFRKQYRQRFYLWPGWAATAAIILILFAFTMLKDHSSISTVRVQEPGNTETVESVFPSMSEDSSEPTLVATVISKVLITEAEARKLKSSIQSESSTLPYYYEEHEDILLDTSGSSNITEDEEGVIQYLEDEFAEFNEGLMLETGEDFGAI